VKAATLSDAKAATLGWSSEGWPASSESAARPQGDAGTSGESAVDGGLAGGETGRGRGVGGERGEGPPGVRVDPRRGGGQGVAPAGELAVGGALQGRQAGA
jgi:hypothetical protein